MVTHLCIRFFFKLIKFILGEFLLRIFKIYLHFIVHYNCTKRYRIIFKIFTKCNDIFKFSISLKLNGVKTFLAVHPKTRLFYIARFLYNSQKIFKNKNFFSKGVLNVLLAFYLLCSVCNKQKPIFDTTIALKLQVYVIFPDYSPNLYNCILLFIFSTFICMYICSRDDCHTF